MKSWKKSVSLLVCALMLATPLMACGAGANNEGTEQVNGALQQTNGNTSNVTDVAGNDIKRPTYYAPPHEFRWVAYSTPPNANVGAEDTDYEGNPDYNTVEHWQTLADCGFNYATPIHYDITDEDKEKTLANAEAVGVKLLFPSTDKINPDSLGYISDQGGTYQEAYNRILANEGKIKERYEKFMKYDSFAGIFGCDEPDATKFAAIAAAQDWFEDNYPQYEFYVNLLPEYATPDQLFGKLKDQEGYESYADHVARFCEIVNPYIMSYDHYCLAEDWTYLEGFFQNLAIVANNTKALEEAYNWEVPFYIYLQSMGFERKSQMKTYEHWAWQVYNSLAFGVTGVQTFNYWPHMADTGNDNATITDALVNRQGEKTDAYGYVKKTIDDIRAMEKVYLSYDWDHTSAWTKAGASKSGLLNEMSSWEGYVDVNDDNGNGNVKERLRWYTDISNISTDQEILIGEFSNRENEDNKAYFVSNASDIQKAAQVRASAYSSNSAAKEEAAKYAAKISLTFSDKVESVKLYKPSSTKPGSTKVDAEAVIEIKTPVNGVVSFTIPLGEGFFVVPVYKA